MPTTLRRGKILMNKFQLVNRCLGFGWCVFLTMCPVLVSASEIQYYKIVGLRGLLTEKQGVDCCFEGKERKINFPAIELKSPINVVSQNPSKPEADETTEIGVTSLQLVMDKDARTLFDKRKGRNARVLCLPFHAINGHHMTAVLCEVKSIDDF